MIFCSIAGGLRFAAAGQWPSLRRLAVIFFCVFVASVTISDGSSAQDVTPLPSRPAIDLPVGQGRLFRFSEPVESVLIADTTIADLQVVSPDVVYVFGLKPGLTNLLAVTADQRIEATAEFRVSADASPANQAKRVMQPTSSTELTIFGNRIVALGHTGNVEEAIDIDNVARTFSPPDLPPINDTTIQGAQQVNIRVRFAEISRSELQSYGVDWSVGYASSGFEFSMFQDNAVPAAGGGNLGFSLGQDHGFSFDVLIEALQRNGIVKILAEPNLTAVTGQTASFLAGGEIPIPVPQSQDTVTVEYKPFGVSLTFTPTLLPQNRIGLHVRPEVSSIASNTAVSFNGFNLPSFVVRKADTMVEVASGQTFAIAGLFQQNFTRNLEKFPVLGDVPVLGALFQSQRFQREETELVILITPYLVEPVSDHSLATPIDRPAPKRRQRAGSSPIGLIVK